LKPSPQLTRDRTLKAG
jgi:hypothetical protein